MAAKLVVTKARGGSKITLVGTSGTELLSSKVFTEPRAKGATLRSLKGLLGEDIVVDDQTVAPAATAPKPVPAAPRRSATKAVAATSGRRGLATVSAEANGAAPKPARKRARKSAK